MINKLRRKFIAIAMVSVTLVLLIILGIINMASYSKINQNSEELLSVLTENGGVFPKPNKIKNGGRKQMPPNMSPEAPYETRFFTVMINNNGSINTVDTGFIAAVSTDDAINYANEVFSRGKKKGFCGEYKYSTVSYDDTTLIVFLDCGRDLSTFRSFLFTSILVSSVGILAVFLLVLVFSKMAVKPVAQSYQKQKRFITDASHEIKTPLAIIDADTDVLEVENGENEWTQSIKNQVARLSSLTASLISLSRMDEETVSMQMTDFSLSDAVIEAVEPFQPLIKASHKLLLIEVEQNLSYHGNEQAIRQLISILMDNGVQYSTPQGPIKVSLKKQGRYHELTFYNTVESIEKGNLDILFERFYRADASRNSQSGGYGIGLSVAKAIVELHHGKVTAKSIDGKSIVITALL